MKTGRVEAIEENKHFDECVTVMKLERFRSMFYSGTRDMRNILYLFRKKERKKTFMYERKTMP